jgi:hypothetical protein
LSSTSTEGSARSGLFTLKGEFPRPQEHFDDDQRQRQEKGGRQAEHARNLQPGARHGEHAYPYALPDDDAARRQVVVSGCEADVEVADERQHGGAHGDVQQHEEQPALPDARERGRHKLVQPAPADDHQDQRRDQDTDMIGRRASGGGGGVG